MILIIGAMDEEVQALLPYFEDLKNQQLYHRNLYMNDEVVIVKSGVGKVEAAYTTTMMLNHFDIDFVINIGSAGGLHPEQKVGDIVIATHLVYHDFIIDVNVEGLGGSRYQFASSSYLVDKAKDVLEKLNLRHHIGHGVSGDQFVYRKEQVSFIKEHFPKALFCEMEATAIGHVCTLMDTDFIILRSLSDITVVEDNHIAFEQYLTLAAKNSAKITYHLVELRRNGHV